MTTTTTTFSGEEGGKTTKFVFPLVPVNSYALDEVSLLSDTNSNNNTNNNITKNTTNEDDEKKANMLPIFTLQPLKKQHTDDTESNNTFIKKYGQPTCGTIACLSVPTAGISCG